MGQSDGQKLQRAIQALKSGDKLTARALFKEALRENPKLEDAWVGLSLCIEDADQKKSCLQRALAINPNHTYARSALVRLEQAQRPSIAIETPKVHRETFGRPRKSGAGFQIALVFLGLLLIAACSFAGFAVFQDLQKSNNQASGPVAQQPSSNVVKDRYRFIEFYSDD